jgi:hypothetical protein
MLNRLIEYGSQEWATVSSAPFTFLIASALVATIAYSASRWKHGAIIELLRERLAAKDQQLDEYRERLHLVPAHGSEFSRLTHTELKTETLKFVIGLREWLAARTAQESQRQRQRWVAMTHATDEKQKEQLWDAQTDDIISSSRSLSNEYDAKFKVKTLVLRDELLTRVQHPDPNSHIHHSYDHPMGSMFMGMVADDLERLARLLR